LELLNLHRDSRCLEPAYLEDSGSEGCFGEMKNTWRKEGSQFYHQLLTSHWKVDPNKRTLDIILKKKGWKEFIAYFQKKEERWCGLIDVYLIAQ
jgi:hypothetical protein